MSEQKQLPLQKQLSIRLYKDEIDNCGNLEALKESYKAFIDFHYRAIYLMEQIGFSTEELKND
jgi:hypothetical protein